MQEVEEGTLEDSDIEVGVLVLEMEAYMYLLFEKMEVDYMLLTEENIHLEDILVEEDAFGVEGAYKYLYVVKVL
ncbi:MAG: hypothetical protein IKP12_07635 [Acholeplasmatales bacterium]|nr:hypothetical protein [Acholeplasmatales bacterium]